MQNDKNEKKIRHTLQKAVMQKQAYKSMLMYPVAPWFFKPTHPVLILEL
jgi:hypothetical protein